MSTPYRDAQTEQVIADARGLVETPDFDDARPVELDPLGVAMGEINECLKLRGEEQSAYAEFCAAAAALEAHQRSATPVLERYKTALAKLSGIAARSGG